MTDLACSVQDCVHNENNLCCASNIHVEGSTAKESCCTCCGTFQKCGCDTAKNSCANPKKETEIACEATNCKYNENSKCAAPHINVIHSQDGYHGHTECSTFKL